MAEKLMLYYKYMKDIESLQGQMKLAMETKIPSIKAATVPDSEENIQKFRDAIRKITGKAPPEL